MNDSSSPNQTSPPFQPRGKLVVLSREMPADLETPVSAFMKLKKVGAKLLLESVESGTILGRYSFIGIKPACRIIANREEIIIESAQGDTHLPYMEGNSPLDSIKNIMEAYNIEQAANQPRLLGGAVGYISYDMVRFLEEIPDKQTDTLEMPLALMYLIDTLLVFDHVQRRIRLLTLTEEDKIEAAVARLDGIEEAMRAPLDLSNYNNGPVTNGDSPVSNFTKEQFTDAVKKAKEHIVAGDIYQIVISQRLHGMTKADHFMIYRALRMLNPSPYMYYLDFDELKLIGSSPEALVRLEDGMATVRPIAGTRPRGETEEADAALASELFNDAKERAEHVMLVDLGRNDLGRCCEIGSVRVTDFMSTEKYSHVMHLTSNVVGKLKSDMDQFDLFAASFPAGTLTGAPKIRAMQLIEEMEKERRGSYGGAVGYFSLSGDMDWCINIRTIVMKGDNYYLQSGAGIVADSVPDKEYQETSDKIAALRKAIEMAERGF